MTVCSLPQEKNQGLKAREQCVVIFPTEQKQSADSLSFLKNRACDECLCVWSTICYLSRKWKIWVIWRFRTFFSLFSIPSHVQDLPRSLRKCSIPPVSPLPSWELSFSVKHNRLWPAPGASHPSPCSVRCESWSGKISHIAHRTDRWWWLIIDGAPVFQMSLVPLTYSACIY